MIANIENMDRGVRHAHNKMKKKGGGGEEGGEEAIVIFICRMQPWRVRLFPTSSLNDVFSIAV